MDGFKVEGKWWLPATPRHQVSGTLTYDTDGIRLIAHDALHEFEPSEPDGGVIHYHTDHHIVDIPVIHGYLRDDGKEMTLFGSSGYDLSGPYERITEQYDCEIALLGGHIEQDQFVEVIMSFDWLDAWLEPPSIEGDDPTKLDTAIINSMPIELHRVSVGENLVTFRCSVVGKHSDSAIHLDRYTDIVAHSTQPDNWKSLVNLWVRPLQDLLTVAIGRTVQLTWIGFQPVDTTKRVHRAWFSVGQPALLPFADAPHTNRPSLDNYTAPTLVTASTVEDFSALVIDWMNAWPQNSTLIAQLLAHLYAPFMYTTQRYGSIFQAIEGAHPIITDRTAELSRQAHRKRVDAVVNAATAANLDAEVIRWARNVLQSRNDKTLAQRVEEVIRSTGKLGDDIMAAIPTFPQLAASLRSSIAHPHSSNADAIRQYWLGEILKWVARTVFLKEAGLTDVAERAAAKATLRHALDVAATWIEPGSEAAVEDLHDEDASSADSQQQANSDDR